MNNQKEIIYPELSYKIIGLAYEVQNKLGYDQKEKYYSRALEEIFKREGLKYEREKTVKLIFNNQCIGKYILDFVVEDKIILELKKIAYLNSFHLKVNQPLEYLNVLNKKLAILIFFTRQGVKYKRIINPKVNL